MNDTFIRDLELLIRSHHPAIHFKTFDYERVHAALLLLAEKLQVPLFTWESGKGLCRNGESPVYGTGRISMALDHIAASKFPAIYHFHSFIPIIGNNEMIACVLQATKIFKNGGGALVISDAEFQIPESLSSVILPMAWPTPSRAEYEQLFRKVVEDFGTRKPVRIEFNEPELTRFLDQLKGLTLDQVKRILSRCLLDDHCINNEDMKKVFEHKKSSVEKDGLMEFYAKEESMDDIAGLTALKDWLAKRKQLISSPETAKKFNLPFPKGLLLIGVQGCGKSLSAKAVAREWGLPILRLEPAKLLDKFIGESEKNFTRALKQAESLAPIVLWIDEIEKIFADGGGENDGGTSQRILGIFLSWLQERSGDVFVVATANNIQKLPAEFVRKGRFDEIFFVDLPKADARHKIFEIFLKKHRLDAAHFDLKILSSKTDGFSGAEIEQVVVSGLYSAIGKNTPLSTLILENEIKVTRPLSVTMAEKVDALREWSKGRAVNADSP